MRYKAMVPGSIEVDPDRSILKELKALSGMDKTAFKMVRRLFEGEEDDPAVVFFNLVSREQTSINDFAWLAAIVVREVFMTPEMKASPIFNRGWDHDIKSAFELVEDGAL